MASAAFCTVHCLSAAFACLLSVLKKTDLKLFVPILEGHAMVCFYMYTICISCGVCVQSVYAPLRWGYLIAAAEACKASSNMLCCATYKIQHMHDHYAEMNLT